IMAAGYHPRTHRRQRQLMHSVTGTSKIAMAGAIVSASVLSGLLAATPAAAQLHMAVEARAALLSRAYNATGQSLLGKLPATPGNTVFSPLSIGPAMSMALTGARGDTATEMMRVLSIRMSSDALDTANAEVLSILGNYDRSATPTCPPGATLNG